MNDVATYFNVCSSRSQANDKDGGVTGKTIKFLLKETTSNEAEMFRVNATTGAVYLEKVTAVDMYKDIEITVQVAIRLYLLIDKKTFNTFS